MARSSRPVLLFIMRFTTYTKYRKSWLDALNLEKLLEKLSEFLLDGGFAGGPHFHPYWGWSGTEDTSSLEALKQALLRALAQSGQLTEEMIEELRGEGPGNPEVQKEIADLLDEIIRKMVEEGYITLDGQVGGLGGSVEEAAGEGQIDEAREAAQLVNFNLTRKGLDFLGYRALRNLLSSMGKSSIGSHETSEYATGVESDAGSKPYEFGDTLNLDLPETLKDTIAREGLQVPPQGWGKTAPGRGRTDSGGPAAQSGLQGLMVHQTGYPPPRHRPHAGTSRTPYPLRRDRSRRPKVRCPSHLIRRVRTPLRSHLWRRAQEIPLGSGKAQVGPSHHTPKASSCPQARSAKKTCPDIMITDGKPSAITLDRGRSTKPPGWTATSSARPTGRRRRAGARGSRSTPSCWPTTRTWYGLCAR